MASKPSVAKRAGITGGPVRLLVAVSLMMAAAVRPAPAATRVISINFDGGGSPIPVDVTAGYVPVANWNNVGTSGQVVLKDNTGTDDFGGTSVRFTGSFGFNGDNGTPSGSDGDRLLWANGTRSLWGGYNMESSQVLFEGLASAFPYGYDVYIFAADPGYTFAYPQGTTRIYESNTKSFFTPSRSDPSGYPVASTDSQVYSVTNNSRFTGTYTLGGNTAKFSAKTQDVAVYTMMTGPTAAGGTFNWANFAGMQIVGEIPDPPSPGHGWHGDGLNPGGSGTWTDTSNT
ncbi:MAG: hypothetical protein FJ275_14490, partial [Planctomycetes bacterium]|nr:hypothetical protein [Planctomycetota bacterium]